VCNVQNPTQVELKARLETHLRQIVRERDPFLATEGHFYVQQYIQQELGQWGTVDVQTLKRRGQTLQNLTLRLPAIAVPTGKPRSPILMGAHYDAVPGSPGADDNATGVAVLLELARAFQQTPARYPIHLVAFDFEETLDAEKGSTAYAELLQGQPLRLMFSLEMLGYCDPTPGSQRYPAGLKRFYPDRGNFIGLIGNLTTIPDLMRLSRSIRQMGVPCEWLPAGQRGLILPSTRRSDHAPFWDRGYRAIMVTDTADLRNPHYHRSSDRLETLDLDFLTRICLGLAHGIRSL
jgi:Zn-dependent M28 family amino/carboxypeptidase